MSTTNSIVSALEAIAETAGAIGDAVQMDTKIETPVEPEKNEAKK
jgi:hypothetical protein